MAPMPLVECPLFRNMAPSNTEDHTIPSDASQTEAEAVLPSTFNKSIGLLSYGV